MDDVNSGFIRCSLHIASPQIWAIFGWAAAACQPAMWTIDGTSNSLIRHSGMPDARKHMEKIVLLWNLHDVYVSSCLKA